MTAPMVQKGVRTKIDFLKLKDNINKYKNKGKQNVV